MTDVLEPPRPAGPHPPLPSVSEETAFAEKPESFGKQTWKRFRSHRLAMIGVVMLVIVVVMFFVGPSLRPFSFEERNVRVRAQGPGTTHWFGTDDIGRDLFVRTMTGGQWSIRIAFITALVGTLVGGTLGAIAGYFGRAVDSVVSFFINLLLTIPALVVLLVLGIRWGAEPTTIALIIAGLSWVRAARVTRAQVLSLKEQEFVMAAKAAGARSGRIIVRHLIPNVAGSLLVEATLLAGTAIILESTLSFLGLGVQPPGTTLGTLIDDAKGSIDTRPYRVLIPGGIVTLIVLSVNFIGDGLRDALDPKSRLERK